MPAAIFARLYRMLPLLVILAVLAVIIYAFVSWRYTTNRAKEVVIKVFLVINGGLSIFFILASLYALLEDNGFVVEFFLTCAAMMLILLGITFYCRHRFLKHNPNYKWKKTKNGPLRDRIVMKRK